MGIATITRLLDELPPDHLPSDDEISNVLNRRYHHPPNEEGSQAYLRISKLYGNEWKDSTKTIAMLKEYQDGFSRVEAAERLARALKGPLRKAPNGIDEQGIIVADNNAGLMPDGLYALKVIKFGTKEFGRMKHTVDYVVEVLEAGAVSTCRNLFYTDVKLFREKQTVADNCVYTLAATIFTVSRGELGLSLLEMGMEIDNDVTISARGAVLFDNLGGRIVCNTTSGMIIPANTVWIRVPPGVAAAVQIEKHCAHTSVRSGLHEPGWLSEGRAQESQDDLQQPPKEELVVLSSRGWPTIGGRILARSIARQMSVCEAPLLHVTDLDYGGIWGLLLNINGATKTSHLYGGYPREDGTVWVVRAGLTARELYNDLLIPGVHIDSQERRPPSVRKLSKTSLTKLARLRRGIPLALLPDYQLLRQRKLKATLNVVRHSPLYSQYAFDATLEWFKQKVLKALRDGRQGGLELRFSEDDSDEDDDDNDEDDDKDDEDGEGDQGSEDDEDEDDEDEDDEDEDDEDEDDGDDDEDLDGDDHEGDEGDQEDEDDEDEDDEDEDDGDEDDEDEDNGDDDEDQDGDDHEDGEGDQEGEDGANTDSDMESDLTDLDTDMGSDLTDLDTDMGSDLTDLDTDMEVD